MKNTTRNAFLVSLCEHTSSLWVDIFPRYNLSTQSLVGSFYDKFIPSKFLIPPLRQCGTKLFLSRISIQNLNAKINIIVCHYSSTTFSPPTHLLPHFFSIRCLKITQTDLPPRSKFSAQNEEMINTFAVLRISLSLPLSFLLSLFSLV